MTYFRMITFIALKWYNLYIIDVFFPNHSLQLCTQNISKIMSNYKSLEHSIKPIKTSDPFGAINIMTYRLL